MLGTDVTPEMSLAKNMKPIQSKQAYELAAKIHRATNHLAAGELEIPVMNKTILILLNIKFNTAI